MLLVQKIPDHDSMLTLKILGRFYQNHKELESDMRKHPEKFEENCEYTTIEIGKFLKVTYEKKAIVKTIQEEENNG